MGEQQVPNPTNPRLKEKNAEEGKKDKRRQKKTSIDNRKIVKRSIGRLTPGTGFGGVKTVKPKKKGA